LSAHVVLTIWTSEPSSASAADAAGIDRIGVDLDVRGKLARQAGLGTWISPHTVDDLATLRPAVVDGRLFARVNPLHDGTDDEVARVLAAGAEVVMLPMFRHAEEVGRFVDVVRGRALVVGLIETAAAVEEVAAVVGVRGVDEVHVGINDLAIELGLPNRFAVLTSPAVEQVADAAAGAGVPFGLGGIGRAMDTSLPIAADLVYAQYARLGATGALVSRSFLAGGGNLATEVQRARARLAWWTTRPRRELEDAARRLDAAVAVSPAF
jgi:hypothetical protein